CNRILIHEWVLSAVGEHSIRSSRCSPTPRGYWKNTTAGELVRASRRRRRSSARPSFYLPLEGPGMTRARLALLNPEGLAQKGRRTHLLPSADLTPFIAVAWMLEWNLEGMEPYTQRVIPNPSVQIVVDGRAAHVMG